MSRLTHRTAPQCTYFVTTKTWQNREVFRVQETAEVVLDCLLRYRDRASYLLHEFVIMPNHVHILLTPGDECTLEKAMQLIKGGSSHDIHLKRERKMHIWQPGFHEWTVRNSEDYESKRSYIWQNPVHRELTDKPEEWIFGSACGKYRLDPVPEKLKDGLQGLKPRV
ncbi:MAG TPA: transposase [Candidatus Acidoferrales bacterium]|nr:transposase [Candidatus Acidoferrales bacterium]